MYFFKLFKNQFIILLGLVVVLAGCVKHDDYYKSVNGGDPNRKTIVKLVGTTDIIQIARDVNPAIDSFDVIEIAREPNSNADLNQPLTVKLQLKPSLIDDYNATNSTSYVALPDSAYTVLGDLNNITFKPGEAIKEIRIRLDKSKLDLSQQYALGYSLVSVGSGAVINSSLSNGLYSIGVKNQYDGHYQVTGTLTDVVNPALVGNYPMDVFLITAGPNSVYLFDNLIGGVYHSIFNTGTGNPSYYGSFGIEIFFDPSGNGKVTSVINVYGQPAGNGRSAQLAADGANQFNLGTKDMDIKYLMLQPGTTVRTTFTEHFKYLGPR